MKKRKININVDEKVLLEAKRKAQKNGQYKLVLNGHQHSINNDNINKDAIKIIEKLQKKGYQAYLVGGCVRDMLLGIHPKDFDISTSATPHQVKSIIPSTIIGKRFIIVHAHVNREIFEITSFRKKSNVNETLNNGVMLLKDNNYSNKITDDVSRRDITINGLYYNPINHELLDFYGGLYDLHAQCIKVIGNTDERFKEDPVRILRVLRFAAKLNFKIDKKVDASIKKHIDYMGSVVPARKYDEINKFFLTGHGYRSFELMKEYKLKKYLIPFVDDAILENKLFLKFFENALKSSDNRFKNNLKNKPSFMYAFMLWPKVLESLSEQQNYLLINKSKNNLEQIQKSAIINTLESFDHTSFIPWLTMSDIESILKLQFAFEDVYINKLPANSINSNMYRAAFDLLELRASVDSSLSDQVIYLKDYYFELKKQAQLRKQAFYEKKQKRLNAKIARAQKRRQRKKLKNE